MYTKEEAKARALAFLAEHETGTIATASLDNRPYASLVYFSYTDDFSVDFICSHHSAKFKNLILNNQASFSVGSGPDYRELVIHGTAQRIDDPKMLKEAEAAIVGRVKSAPANWPVHVVKSLTDGGSALFRITAREVLFLDLTDTEQMESLAKHFYTLVP